MADDGAFRVISWQVDEGNGTYKYVGYIQLKNGLIRKFDSEKGRVTHKSDNPCSVEDWTGGLVYKILSAEDGYYLLTFKMIDAFTKVKTLEPISINEGITLGRPGAFDINRRGASARLSLVHSADSNAQITYESSTRRFIFDHLIAVQGRMEGQGPTFVPDGSYRAFEYQDGGWTYIDKLYDQVNDGPLDPTRKQKLDNRLTTRKSKKNK